MDRRQFIATASLWASGGFAASSQGANRYVVEARQLTRLIHRTFWDPGAQQYRAPVRSAETVDSDPVHNNGYVLWPCVEFLHALLEPDDGERSRTREDEAHPVAERPLVKTLLGNAGQARMLWLLGRTCGQAASR